MATDVDGEVRDVSVAIEDIAALAVVVLGAGDVVVVGIHDIIVEENKSCTSV